MSPELKSVLKRWLANTLAMLVAAFIVPGINYTNWSDLLLASLLLGVLNAILRPVLLIIALPLVLYTLGFFILIINALVLYFVGALLPGFQVRDFWSAFWGAIIVSIVALIINLLIGTGGGSSRVRFHRQERPPEPPTDPNPPPGNGPVIDI
jgi:putative membrane protein